jgi:predicted nucleic acid-binding protein
VSASPPLPGPPKGLVAVLDTSVLVRAWRSTVGAPNPSRRAMLLAGIAYDSFTSPAILSEVAQVLARPRFGSSPGQVYSWLDAFVRASRQVFPESIPGDDADAVGGDQGDLPILKTTYAVFAAAAEYPDVLEQAGRGEGFFLVSENTTDFLPGRNVHGFQFTRAHHFLELLLSRGSADRG